MSLLIIWLMCTECERRRRRWNKRRWGLWSMCFRCRADEASPLVGHMVLIRESREERQPACRTNKIQCCINITHPLLSCCVYLHMLMAMWTGSVLTELSEQSWQCGELCCALMKKYEKPVSFGIEKLLPSRCVISRLQYTLVFVL